VKIDADYTIVGYPSSRIPKLEPNTQAVIEIFCELVLLYYTNSRLLTKKKTKSAIFRCVLISTMLLYEIVSNILILGTDYS
jgi:hypothetical protein